MAVTIPFVTLDEPRYGEVVQVAPHLQRVTAKNPSKFTYFGTGTYLVGDADVAVIDPGPDSPSHQAALERALEGRRVTAIVVTHCHNDHSPLAGWLSQWSGAPTIGVGPYVAVGEEWPYDRWPDFPLSPEVLEELKREAEQSDVVIEEANDRQFVPAIQTVDGEVCAAGDGWTLRAVHTPGHAANHLCVAFDEQRALFTGDHVMGWSTTVISPPDGDMVAYFESLDRVIERGDQVLYPTHGAPVTDPVPFLAAYRAHRRDRERQVIEAIGAGMGTLAEMVPALYAAVHPALHAPAARSVMSHVIALVAEGRVRAEGGVVHPLARFIPASAT